MAFLNEVDDSNQVAGVRIITMDAVPVNGNERTVRIPAM